MAIITSSAFAALKAPMPEFKNDKQLAEWRAGKASQASSQGYTKEEPAFYTGKPYLASSGSYAFKYRSYDPEMARWTSEDPSGFPDGANSNVYAPCPTIEVDSFGLKTVSVGGTPKTTTTIDNFFEITVDFAPRQVGSNIQGESQVKWTIGAGLSGWVVQQISYEEKVFVDKTNAAWTSPVPLGPTFWEAFRVDAGVAQGPDYFSTQNYPQNTHGSYTATGKVGFYSDTFLGTSNNLPQTWSTTSVSATGGLPAVTSQPTWWTGGGSDHTLTLKWE